LVNLQFYIKDVPYRLGDTEKIEPLNRVIFSSPTHMLLNFGLTVILYILYVKDVPYNVGMTSLAE
jgi:hypothetical protein